MPSAAVISHAFVSGGSSSQQQERKMALASGGAAVTEHLSRVAARARTTGTGPGRAGTVRRAQSAKSAKRSVPRNGRASSSSVDPQQRKKKGLLEFGPLRFITSNDEGKRLRPSSLQRNDTHKPGLRAMLYGLTMKMEREEKMQKKLQKKRAGQPNYNIFCKIKLNEIYSILKI